MKWHHQKRQVEQLAKLSDAHRRDMNEIQASLRRRKEIYFGGLEAIVWWFAAGLWVGAARRSPVARAWLRRAAFGAVNIGWVRKQYRQFLAGQTGPVRPTTSPGTRMT